MQISQRTSLALNHENVGIRTLLSMFWFDTGYAL